MIQKLRDLKLGVKIGGGFVLLIIIGIVMAYMGYSSLSLVAHKVDIGQGMTKLERIVLQIRETEKNFMLNNSKENINQLNQEIAKLNQTLEETKQQMNVEAEKKQLEELKKLIIDYKEAANNYINSTQQQNEYRAAFVEQENKLVAAAHALSEKQSQELSDAVQSEAAFATIEQKRESIMLAQDVVRYVQDIGRQERNLIINLSNDQQQKKYIEQTRQEFANATQTLNQLKNNLVDQEDIERANNLLVELETGKKAFENIVKTEQNKDKQKPIMEETAEKVLAKAEGINNKKTVEITETESSAISGLLSAAVVATVLGILFAVIITRSITKPVLAGVEFAQKIADGKFDIEDLEVKTSDEVGTLANALNRMKNKLSTVLLRVRESAQNVANGADEISDGNQDLSQRTQEQSSSLEEVSATIEEINSSIQEVANNSEEADELSDRTMEAVNKGSEVVEETMDSMEEITASSREIAEIITTVNDIAFQTNLLALNAAVEAARAGEDGRGFAVVASEVRNLAGQAANSAEEIEKLITTIIDQIEEGNELVEETGEALDKIIANSQQTSQMVSQIASAMEQQASATNEMQDAVEELDQTTQQNASMVEEIASASENLNAEARDMTDAVRQFKLSSQNRGNQQQTQSSADQQQSQSKKEDDQEQGLNDLEESMGSGFNEDDFEKF